MPTIRPAFAGDDRMRIGRQGRMPRANAADSSSGPQSRRRPARRCGAGRASYARSQGFSASSTWRAVSRARSITVCSTARARSRGSVGGAPGAARGLPGDAVALERAHREPARRWRARAASATRPIQPRCRCRRCADEAPAPAGLHAPRRTSGRSSARGPSVARLVDQLVLPDPRHHRAQLLADHLDRVLRRQPAARQQRRRAGAVLEDEVARVLARLDARRARPSSPSWSRR